MCKKKGKNCHKKKKRQKKKRNTYKTIYVNFLFIKQKEGIEQRVAKRRSNEIPNNFQSHRKNLAPHRLPHKVTQSGGFSKKSNKPKKKKSEQMI